MAINTEQARAAVEKARWIMSGTFTQLGEVIPEDADEETQLACTGAIVFALAGAALDAALIYKGMDMEAAMKSLSSAINHNMQASRDIGCKLAALLMKEGSK